jgi:hypothetical protein
MPHEATLVFETWIQALRCAGSEVFAQGVDDGASIGTHSWSPLIHYVKRVKRYKPIDGQTVYKERPIMHASHRDTCILSKYASDLTRTLDEFYEREELTTHVIGYRRLGKSNYDFSADAYRFAKGTLRASFCASTSLGSSTISTIGC